MSHTSTLLSAKEQLQKGITTPTKLVQACFERIQQTEPVLHACLHVQAEKSLQEAAELEKKGIDKNAPLWGIPLTVKDNLCTQDMPTTCASHMLEGFMSPYDATVVERLKKAGALIIAKNNMDEFAMGTSTEFSAFGATNNPWDTTRIPGGSSGGSAASVVACQSFGSLGSDTGGSIRQPAALCGCIGLKPTYGRVSRYGAVALASSFDQVGPLARNVADCTALFAVIAGYDAKDATSATHAVPNASDIAFVTQTHSLKGITLGIIEELWEKQGSEEVQQTCARAIEIAQELGAKIVKISMPSMAYAAATYAVLSNAEASTNLARFDGVRFGNRVAENDLEKMYAASRSKNLGLEVQRRILLGTYVLSGESYTTYFQQAAKIRRLIYNDYTKALEQCHALINPTVAVTAWKHKSFSTDPAKAFTLDAFLFGANLSGLPALSLPAGLGATSGLPVGLHLTGRAFQEVPLFAIAHALEQKLPTLGTPKGIS